ncbi:MAG TPA: hypothetical protein DCS93_02135 [Microscillaceae bacterium]|nr:hypothetical protein [Microscillaceae bacterium]
MIKLFSNCFFSKRKRAIWLFLFLLASVQILTAQHGEELILNTSEKGGKALKEYKLGDPLYATWTINKTTYRYMEGIRQDGMSLTVYSPNVGGRKEELIIYKVPQKIVADKRYVLPLFIPGDPKSVLALMLKKSKNKLRPGVYKMRFDIFIGYNNITKNEIQVNIDEKERKRILSLKGMPKTRKKRPFSLFRRASKKKNRFTEAEYKRVEERRRLDAQLKRKAKKIANTLKGKKITQLTITPKYYTVKPGGYIPLSVVATLANGKQLITKGYGKGKTPWSEYKVEVKGGKFSGDKTYGGIHVFRNGLVLQKLKHKVEVKVTSVHLRDVSHVIEIPISLKKIAYRFSGGNNLNGASGRTPLDYGQKGGHGQDGRNGENGPHIKLYMDVVYDEVLKQKMRLHKVSTPFSSYIVFTHLEEAISIDASGGHGGRGGNGGNGGKTNACRGIMYPGSGGDGGNGGNGGNGGSFDVYLTPEASKYKQYIKLTSDGGAGGEGGKGGDIGKIIQYANCPTPSRGGASSGQDGRNGSSGVPTSNVTVSVEKFTIK